MGKAEVGTPKYVANKMKAKGLQKLKWYCQVCEKQCRDENGFKCHTQSESHLRQILVAGENFNGKISEYSRDFQNDFIRLLKSAHQEKLINVNRFYQEYIANKNHIHMNATKWATLSQFAKHLDEIGLCRVEETEKDGLCIAWIDNSPRALEIKNTLSKKKDDESEDNVQEHILQKQISAAIKQKAILSKGTTPSTKPINMAGTLKINLKDCQVIKDSPKPQKPKNVFARTKKKKILH